MRWGRLAVLVASTGFWAAFTRPAFAASPVAEALFQEGRRLLEQGQVDEACAKLGESYAQEASSGTLLNLGLCHETQHLLATAWAEYRAAARLARRQGREDRAMTAEEKASSLEPRLPHLVLAAVRTEAGLSVTVDQQALGSGVLGVPVPLDPGRHVLTASAPGFRTFTTEVELAESERRSVTLPELEALPVAAQPPPAAVAPAQAPTSKAAPAPKPDKGSSRGTATAGWIAIGGGSLSLATGAVLGFMSLAAYHDADHACPSHSGCSPAAMEDRSRAETTVWASTVAFGVGIVAVGVGAYLVLRSGSEPTRAAVWAAPNAAGFVVTEPLP